jgi:hypothetical protein
MIVITADQIGSRHGADLADDALTLLERLGRDRSVLPPDRTAGDEVQAIPVDGAAALDAALALLRTGRWSVGLGIGRVRTPLPEVTRAADGSAFIAARQAVDAAKRRPLHFAIAADDPAAAETLGPLIELLLVLRDRRTDGGWEVFDLVESGLDQKAAATRLGITPQAASNRAQAASIRLDAAARVALARLLDDASSAADTVAA